MTVFGPAWADLTLADVQRFLDDAENEPLLWEAKGDHPDADPPRPDAHEVRKQVCGFANGHEEGYLILGARWDGPRGGPGRWAPQPVTFPDEPQAWVSRVVHDGVRPYPEPDTHAWSTENGRHVAVVRVPPIAAPPCICRGTVYERVAGATIPVRDPQRLSEMYVRGERAHSSAARGAQLAAQAVPDTATVAPVNPEHLRFSLGVAYTGRPDDVSCYLFTERFENELDAVARRLTRQAPVINHVWTQGSITAWHRAEQGLPTSVLLFGGWDATVGIAVTIEVGQASLDDVVQWIGRAWDGARALQRELGAHGEGYLYLQIGPQAIGVRRAPHEGGNPVVIRRGPVRDVDARSQLPSIQRELERATGQRAYEQDAVDGVGG